MTTCLRRVGWLLLCGLLLQPGAVLAQATSEAQLKAAFLISFMKYVEWPNEQSTLTLCVRGREAVFPHLARYQGRTIGRRLIEVRKLAETGSLKDCDQLYLAEPDGERVRTVIQQLARQPVLVTGDGENFLGQGGTVALLPSDGRIQFDINLGALSRSGLKVATPMLRLARRTLSGEVGAK